MIIHKCDKCGKNVAQKRGEKAKEPASWLTLRPCGYGRTPEYEICPDCQEALKIPKVDSQQFIGEQLIELITEIAQEAVEQ